LKVTVFGDTAIATGDFKAKGTDASGKPLISERFTDTWVKMPNGQWQCVASHVSPIKKWATARRQAKSHAARATDEEAWASGRSFVILLIAWISGLTVMHVASVLINLLLVFAVISLVLHFVLGKRAT
jgi:hypothetical protein